MIIVSSRKFRDSQNEYFEIARKEEVILKTLHYGNFRLVPIKEPKVKQEKKKTAGKKSNASIYIPDELLKNIATVSQLSEKEEATSAITTLENDNLKKEIIQSPTPVVVEEPEHENTVETPIQTIESVSNIEESKVIEEVNKTEENVVIQAPATEPEETRRTYTKLSTVAEIEASEEEPKEKSEIDYIEQKLNSTLTRASETNKIEANESSQESSDPKHDEEPSVKEEWKPGNVFVDPSLLSLEEVRIQEGLEELNKKETFFTKLFKKKK